MRNYEGVFILNPDLAGDAAKNAVVQVQEMVSKNGGRVDGLQEWGKRRLAYKIGKRNEGTYLVVNFQMDSLQTRKLEQALRLNDQVLRYLLVNKDAL
jgi:small subunit ribosomal protein S6